MKALFKLAFSPEKNREICTFIICKTTSLKNDGFSGDYVVLHKNNSLLKVSIITFFFDYTYNDQRVNDLNFKRETLFRVKHQFVTVTE